MQVRAPIGHKSLLLQVDGSASPGGGSRGAGLIVLYTLYCLLSSAQNEPLYGA